MPLSTPEDHDTLRRPDGDRDPGAGVYSRATIRASADDLHRVSTNDMDDRQLLEGLRQSDQAAFDAIFRVHYPHLVAFVERMLRQRAVAEDIAQDVMLELWRRRETLVVQDSLRAYLF